LNPATFDRMRITFTSLIVFLTLLSAQYSIAQVNQKDANGLKQGAWEKKFPNGKLRYKGQFRDDVPVGTFTYYFEEGGKSAEIQHLSEGAGAMATFFHKNGTVMGEGLYVQQQKEGEWKFYDNKSVLSSIDHYKEGKLHGTSKVLYLNGDISAEYVYENGMKSGPFKEYFTGNKLSIEGTFKNDSFDGDYKSYHDSGQLKEEGQYVDGKKDGHWVYYAPEGQIMAQEIYEMGELTKQKVEESFQQDKLLPVELNPDDIIDESEVDPTRSTWDGDR